MCPNCRQNAPIVYRGVSAYCTACGAPRLPLAGESVNLAGQPSKVGGTVARVIGWVVLAAGTVLGFGTFAACGAITSFAAAAPYVIGLPILAVTALVAWGLLKSGRDLEEQGDRASKATRARGIFALANTRGGVLTAMDVARSQDMTLEQADAVLTAIAKENPEHVSVDIAEDGTVLYRFNAAHWATMHRIRLDETPPTRVGQEVRIDAREPLENAAVDTSSPRARHAR